MFTPPTRPKRAEPTSNNAFQGSEQQIGRMLHLPIQKVHMFMCSGEMGKTNTTKSHDIT